MDKVTFKQSSNNSNRSSVIKLFCDTSKHSLLSLKFGHPSTHVITIIIERSSLYPGLFSELCLEAMSPRLRSEKGEIEERKRSLYLLFRVS